MKIHTILSAALATATLVSAGKFHPLESDEMKVLPKSYIIEYEDGLRHSDADNLLNAHKVKYQVRNKYNIFHGASLSIKSSHMGEALAEIPGIKNVWHVTIHSIPKTVLSTKKPTDPDTVSDHSMTGVDILHKRYKLTGKGIKIGIIDTGVDYTHPAFATKGTNQGCFGQKNCRVAYGWDFVGDEYNGYNEPKPDADPMDCFGHGSHVAGIIGANAKNIKGPLKPPQPFVGVAPEVTLGAYRVYGCDGSAADDVILAAMERAFNDGMDILNMSLGGGSAYRYNPQSVLAERLIARGMALSAAAGNDGGDGVWMVTDIGLGDKATSVASFESTYGNHFWFKYGGAVYPYASSFEYGDKPFKVSSGAALAPIFEKNGELSDGCDPKSYKGVKGKIVLTLGDGSRCDSAMRGEFAMKAGAVGMLIQPMELGLIPVEGLPKFPMGSLENRGGDKLIAAYKKNPKNTFKWGKSPIIFHVEGGGAPSEYSSFGMDGELRSKPDIAAPGGNILSTVPVKDGGYAVMSGTSMASPYIAGAHALYMQSKKSKPKGDVIRQALKNTATIGKMAGRKTYASTVKQGAGLVNVLNAVLATTTLSPDHIDLLDTNHLQKTVKITIRNDGKHTETYRLNHIAADALNSYHKNNSFPLTTPTIADYHATVSFSPSKVKIRPGKSAQVTLRFKEPKKGNAAEFPIYSGYIEAIPKSHGGIPVHVPYAGVKGDIAKVPMLDVDSGFPAVLAENDGKLRDIPEGFTFDLVNDRPVVVIRLGSHTPDFSIRILDSKTKAFLGFVSSPNAGPAFGWVGRDRDKNDSGNIAFKPWFWTGEVFQQADLTKPPVQLPGGEYDIVVAAQRKLSFGKYPEDYEVFNLGSIRIASL
ncbi:hypothetical protein BGZ50_004914 [Haplosporangium sp. Z 11]|nr:hypothetical protein BGZ50_004914 [Haplosporangium sp. Z 11]